MTQQKQGLILIRKQTVYATMSLLYFHALPLFALFDLRLRFKFTARAYT